MILQAHATVVLDPDPTMTLPLSGMSGEARVLCIFEQSVFLGE